MATILIVDDVSTSRAFLRRVLRAQGHRLVEASDGLEGLSIIRTEQPDLVITDIDMPVMDGYEFLRALRFDAATSRLPVVFYTAAYDGSDAARLGLAAEVSDVVMKSASAERVVRAVERALSASVSAGGGH